ncbi:MAG TPA: kelch repeat-containing protein [Terracidiphilus sp.]|nr:kelch repeat-containing protein [Terracidiphilus sp.]
MGIRANLPASVAVIALLSSISIAITGCNNSDPSPHSIPVDATYTVSGSVSGLTGGGLMLQINAGGNLSVSADGPFSFSTLLSAGSSYLVTVLAQPSNPAESCIVANAAGSVGTANVSNIQIGCSAVPAAAPAISTAQNQWTWAGGATVPDQAGVYGTQGTPSVSNIPGARTGAVSWTDTSGNLWLFGGVGPTTGGGCRIMDALCWSGSSQLYNDLWKFDGSEWTWVSGSDTANQESVYGTMGTAAAGNMPGARYGAVSWRDASGNFWLFGGIGIDSSGQTGPLNELWKLSGGQWTWVGGSNTINQPGQYGTEGQPAPGNLPGSRAGAIAFADSSGNVWLFGGQGCDSTKSCGSALNDLWEYSGGQWTWVSGANVAFPAQPGVYGALGVAGQGYHPGGRYNPMGWMDKSGNLWTFGGVGYNTYDDNLAELNDLWTHSNAGWAWMGGSSSVIDTTGTYGTMGTPAPGNIPGSRDSAMTWTDATGNLWLFGGEGYGATGGGNFNDLWMYNGSEWTWMNGADSGGQTGVYGSIGVPAAGNVPGSRLGAVTWTDAKGNLWLFGGTGDSGLMNDLWVYQP